MQAEAQLAGTGVQLMKIALATTPGHVDWLAANTRAGQRIGVTDRCWARRPSAPCRPPPPRRAPRWRSAPTCWTTSEGRAGLPDARIYEHVAPQACVSRADKLAQVREAMRKHGADAHFISTLDDIARLFNPRGADVTTTRCSSAMRWSA